MGRVVVRAEDLAGRQDLDRGLFGLHDMDLPCRGLGPEQIFRGQIEGVLHISGRMVHRGVQSREVVVVVLDLGSLVDLKSHSGENIDHLVLHLGNGVKIAADHLLCGDRDIDLLLLIAVLQLRLPGFLFHLCQIFQDPVFEDVDILAEFGFLLLGNAAHFFHQRVHFARLAVQVLLAKFIDAAGVCAALGLFQELLPDLIKPAHSFSFLI